MTLQMLALVCLTTCVANAQQPVLELSVPCQPQTVTMDGQSVLSYELHIKNNSTTLLDVVSLEVLDKDSNIISLIDKQTIANIFSAKNDGIPPSTTGVLYLDVVVAKPVVMIEHRVIAKRLAPDGNPFAVEGGVVELRNENPPILGAPLKGGPWTAVFSPVWERGHRRVFYTVDGKHHIPGRFAIDFIRMDNSGKYVQGNEDSIARWYGYGSDVLAVADGVVVGLRTDFTESSTLAAHQQPAAEGATGNYVAIEIGEGQVAFYEHLKPGSIRVSPGQRVKKGQVIASLGFTGQSTGPHLHFHLADTNSPLGAEGIPFVFEEFTLLGEYADMNDFGKRLWQISKGSHPKTVKEERPGPNAVVRFE